MEFLPIKNSILVKNTKNAKQNNLLGIIQLQLWIVQGILDIKNMNNISLIIDSEGVTGYKEDE